MRNSVEFNEAWMKPSGKYGQVAPESSRVSRKYKSPRVEVKSRAIPRCMVKVVRLTPVKWEVTMADGGKVVAIVASTTRGSYSYRLMNDGKLHGNFGSLKAAVTRVLEKI